MKKSHIFSIILLSLILFGSIAVFLGSFKLKNRSIPVEVLDTLIVMEKADITAKPYFSPPSSSAGAIEATPSFSQGDINKPVQKTANSVQTSSRGKTSGTKRQPEPFRRGSTIKANADTVQTILDAAEAAFDRKDYRASLELFRKARTVQNTALERSEIVKICINGEAKCLREMRLNGMTP